MPDNANLETEQTNIASSFSEEQIQGVYDLLRLMANRRLSDERNDHTLTPTDLVHEAWMRLSPGANGWDSKHQFLAAAAVAMLRTLIDHARARTAGKRRREMKLDITISGLEQQTLSSADLIHIDELINQLADADKVMSQVVVMRLFGGYEHKDIAEILAVSERTVIRKWKAARNWLTVEL